MHRDYKWIGVYLLLSSFFFTSADISLIIDTKRHFFDIITGRPASLIVIEFKIILLDNFKSYYRIIIIIFYCEYSYCNKLQNRGKNPLTINVPYKICSLEDLAFFVIIR